MQKNNEEIRNQARIADVKHWQIADHLHISEATLTRKLRHDLKDEEKEQILKAIAEIKDGKK